MPAFSSCKVNDGSPADLAEAHKHADGKRLDRLSEPVAAIVDFFASGFVVGRSTAAGICDGGSG